MNVIPITDRETFSLVYNVTSLVTYVLCPYVDLGDAGDVTLEVLLHELVNTDSTLFWADLLVYAATCSPDDPQVTFRGPLIKKVRILAVGVGGVAVEGLGGSWGTGIAVDLQLYVAVAQ